MSTKEKEYPKIVLERTLDIKGKTVLFRAVALTPHECHRGEFQYELSERKDAMGNPSWFAAVISDFTEDLTTAIIADLISAVRWGEQRVAYMLKETEEKQVSNDKED